jgi:hypothetical protein
MTMAFRRKSADPIDRAIVDLDRQIATVQRQLRQMETQPGRALEHRQTGAASPVPAQTFAKFVKNVLAPPKRTVDPSFRERQDLFDVSAEPLKDLEAEPIAFAKKPEPDLFAHAPGTTAGPVAALETAQVVPPQDKLAHYLGAGSIKSYKPLRRVQRQTRNRFFMWLGLSFVALWIIWFVIR